MSKKVYSQNGVLLSVGTGGSGQSYHAGDGITIDDNYISVDAHTTGNIEGNGTTDNPIKLKDNITLDTVNADTVTGIKGNFGDVLIGRSDKVSVFIQKVKDLENNQHEYIGGDHISITDYIINLDNDVALKADLPDLTDYALKSELTDFITSDALNNYYIKSDTYNKNEVNDLIFSNKYYGSDHIEISDNNVISVKDLANSTVTSKNKTVTVVPTENEDGSINYDLSVVGSEGGDVNIIGQSPITSVNDGSGNWTIGIDLSDYDTSEEVDEKLSAYQTILTAGSNNVRITNNKIYVDDTVYTGQSPILVNDKVISFDDSAFATKAELETEKGVRQNSDDNLQTEIDNLQDQINNLPGELTAGTNIDITDGVISVTGIKDHEYTGDEYINVDNVNDKITLIPKWVDLTTYSSDKSAIEDRATSLEGRMTVVENGKADIGLLNNYYTKPETLNVTEINNLVASKQDKLTAGDHISIVGNTISATGLQPSGDYATNTSLTNETNARIAGDNALANDIAAKQDPISAGDHIRIDDGVTINAVGLATSEELQGVIGDITTLNVKVNDLDNDKQDKLIAGTGVTIIDNVITFDSQSRDVLNLVGGNDISIIKDEASNDVIISSTGISRAEFTYALAGKQNLLTAGNGITIENNVISSSGAPNIVYVWDFLSDLLSTDRNVSRTHNYPDTVMTFGNKYNNGFVLPAHAKVQLTVCGESAAKNGNAVITPIIVQADSQASTNPIQFTMDLNTTKILNKTFGYANWECIQIDAGGTYYCSLVPTTYYFEVGDSPVNSNELFTFHQNGLLYTGTTGSSQVSFGNYRISLNCMYWV